MGRLPSLGGQGAHGIDITDVVVDTQLRCAVVQRESILMGVAAFGQVKRHGGLYRRGESRRWQSSAKLHLGGQFIEHPLNEGDQMLLMIACCLGGEAVARIVR